MSSPSGQQLGAQIFGEDLASTILNLKAELTALRRDSYLSGTLAGAPLGWITPTPTLPASTVVATNTYNRPVTVYITGGTVTAIVIDGVTHGFLAGSFRLKPSGTIAITYSVAPTWKWYGD
jgi:hypothetical protein